MTVHLLPGALPRRLPSRPSRTRAIAFAVVAGLASLAGVLASPAAAAPPAAAPLSVQALSREPGKRMPFVRGEREAAQVARRINQALYLEMLERPAPERAADGLRGVGADAWRGLAELDFQTVRRDARLLVLRFDGDGCGAYCENFTRTMAFDAATGRELAAPDLFTPEGLQAVQRRAQQANIAAIRRQIAELRRDAPARRDAASEDLFTAIEMYESCLRMRQDASYQQIEGVGGMQIEADAVSFVQGRCSNHALRALDDLGSFTTRLPRAQLRPLLTPYGRDLLLGEARVPAPDSPLGQVLRGRIGDRLAITLRLQRSHPDGSLSGVYFYDRYRTPIELSGSWRDGQLRLRESDTIRWSLAAERDGLRGEWGDGQRTLPVRLAP